MIDTTCCLGSCITGQWEQVQADLQSLADYVGRCEAGKKLAEFVGASAVSLLVIQVNFVDYYFYSL